MNDFPRNPTPQYEKKTSQPKISKPVRITKVLMDELIEMVRENKSWENKATKLSLS